MKKPMYVCLMTLVVAGLLMTSVVSIPTEEISTKEKVIDKEQQILKMK